MSCKLSAIDNVNVRPFVDLFYAKKEREKKHKKNANARCSSTHNSIQKILLPDSECLE